MAKLIKFRATVCNPCKMLDQAIKDLCIEIDEEYNVEIDSDMVEKYDVMKSPTIILVDEDGNEVDRAIGLDIAKVVELNEKKG